MNLTSKNVLAYYSESLSFFNKNPSFITIRTIAIILYIFQDDTNIISQVDIIITFNLYC